MNLDRKCPGYILGNVQVIFWDIGGTVVNYMLKKAPRHWFSFLK